MYVRDSRLFDGRRRTVACIARNLPGRRCRSKDLPRSGRLYFQLIRSAPVCPPCRPFFDPGGAAAYAASSSVHLLHRLRFSSKLSHPGRCRSGPRQQLAHEVESLIQVGRACRLSDCAPQQFTCNIAGAGRTAASGVPSKGGPRKSPGQYDDIRRGDRRCCGANKTTGGTGEWGSCVLGMAILVCRAG